MAKRGKPKTDKAGKVGGRRQKAPAAPKGSVAGRGVRTTHLPPGDLGRRS